MFKSMLVAAALAFSTVATGCVITTSDRFSGSTASGGDCRLDGPRAERVARISVGSGQTTEALFIGTTQLGTDYYRVQVFAAQDVPGTAARSVLEERLYQWPFTSDGASDTFEVVFQSDRVRIDINGIPNGAGCSFAF
jgi:hypothetical protein